LDNTNGLLVFFGGQVYLTAITVNVWP